MRYVDAENESVRGGGRVVPLREYCYGALTAAKQDGSGRSDTGEGCSFHEALPFIERIGMLTGKEEIVHWNPLQSCHRSELARAIAGVAAFG